jgi:hypothetical protein
MTERMGTILLSVLVGHTAWHWMTDRWTTLRAFEGPSLGSVSILTVVRLVLGILLTVAFVGLARWNTARRRAADGPLEESRDARPA